MGKIIKDLFSTAPRLKVLSGLFTNLSAGWIGAVVIFQNFSNLSIFKDKLIWKKGVINEFC